MTTLSEKPESPWIRLDISYVGWNMCRNCKQISKIKYK